MTNDQVQRPLDGHGAVVGAEGRTPLHLGVDQNDGGNTDTLVWEVGSTARSNYRHVGRRLAECLDLYRNGTEGRGLIQVTPSGQTRLLRTAADLAPLLADRLPIRVTKDGNTTGDIPSAPHLNAMLRSETFLSCFKPLDGVVQTPFYLPDFSLIEPGYRDGGIGERFLYIGPTPEIANSTETIKAFLDVMDFASSADRTNTVAAAMTVQLRHHWPGEKPVVSISATKSFSGKNTIADFVQGSVAKADVLYQDRDWPMQRQFQTQLRANPNIALVLFDNVRLDSSGGRSKFIRSAFLESFVTSREVVLASPGAGEPMRLANNFVAVITTNDGSLSPDLSNRALSIHLAAKGDVQGRQSPIGNPRLEYLPQNRAGIEAELRGMIGRWKTAGCPPDSTINHPMTSWARTMGGILKLNGFSDFLANQGTRRTVDDPIRHAIGILGAANPGNARPPRDWAALAVEQGLAKVFFSTVERDTQKGRERAIGVVLSSHLDETFDVESEEAGQPTRLRLQLHGGYRRWERGGSASNRYLFEVLGREVLPLDEVTERTAPVAVE
jgi:hypothetical protein